MYKGALLNSNINRVMGNLGHTNCICIADCGLPIPKEVEKIDLALRDGEPSFFDVLSTLSPHMVIEKIFLAEEIIKYNPECYADTMRLLPGVTVELLPHEAFKNRLHGCTAVIRTGEKHPYANVILQAGCIF